MFWTQFSLSTSPQLFCPAAMQIGALEDTRKQVLQGTLEVQKCFRAHRARRHFHDLKQGVTALQSCKEAVKVFSKFICDPFEMTLHKKFCLENLILCHIGFSSESCQT